MPNSKIEVIVEKVVAEQLEFNEWFERHWPRDPLSPADKFRELVKEHAHKAYDEGKKYNR